MASEESEEKRLDVSDMAVPHNPEASKTTIAAETKVAKVESDIFVVPEKEHRLQTPWTIHWYSKHDTFGTPNEQAYLSNIHSLGTFNSIESFWKHYCHLNRPSRIGNGYNIAIFRANLVPAWEAFPNGGCWIIRVSKKELFLNRLWEELILSVIGENFLTPELVGVVLAVRREVANITIWNRDNRKNDVRFRIGERLKEELNLDEESTVEYKFFADALKDHSTTRNATLYTYTMVES